MPPPGRTIRTRDGVVAISMGASDATVWVSSLDGRPIAASRRLLVTHLTDLQNSRYPVRRGIPPDASRVGRAATPGAGRRSVGKTQDRKGGQPCRVGTLNRRSACRKYPLFDKRGDSAVQGDDCRRRRKRCKVHVRDFGTLGQPCGLRLPRVAGPGSESGSAPTGSASRSQAWWPVMIPHLVTDGDRDPDIKGPNLLAASCVYLN